MKANAAITATNAAYFQPARICIIFMRSGKSNQGEIMPGKSPRPLALSPRQLTIIKMAAEGYSNKDMASMLGISVKTVESHRSEAMDRIGVNSLAHLVRYAVKHGLVSASVILLAIALATTALAQQRTIYGPDGRPSARTTTDSQGTTTIYGPDGRALSRWSKDSQGNTNIYSVPDGRKLGTIGQPKEKR
jgi:DNA-binding CsgD family transcriptional regulator